MCVPHVFVISGVFFIDIRDSIDRYKLLLTVRYRIQLQVVLYLRMIEIHTV